MKILKLIKKSDYFIGILIVIGIIAVLNFLSYQLFYRLDLTQNKIYSITEASKNTVENLDDIINIKVYFSSNLPSDLINLPQEVKDLLEEYGIYSGGKIRSEFIDPLKLENHEQEMYKIGIPALQFNILEKDKYQVSKGYLGMTVQYGDNKEIIPIIENIRNLEYEITAAIKKVSAGELATIGFLTSHNSLDIEKEISAVYEKISELYSVVSLDLNEEDKIPANIDTLLIIGPKEEFSEYQLKELDKFVMRKGVLIVLLDSVNVDQYLETSLNETNIADLLDKYGFKINKNLILDYNSSVATFSSGGFPFLVNYPFWPKINRDGLDLDNPVVAKLENLVLPWVSSMDIKDINQEDFEISVLAQSSLKSWRETENFNLDPDQKFLAKLNQGKNILAISAVGKIKSAYSEDSVENAKIAIIGDSNFIEDKFLGNYPENLIFFQNLVDSLSLDDDLITIRSKQVLDRPIKEISETEKNILKYFNIFGIAAIFLIFGLAKYYWRRKRK